MIDLVLVCVICFLVGAYLEYRFPFTKKLLGLAKKLEKQEKKPVVINK